MFVTVIIANTTRKFDKEYTYEVPESLNADLKIGSSVMVPFGNGNKLVYGLITSIFEHFHDSNITCKQVSKICREYPLINERSIKLLKWMKEKYISTYFNCLRLIMPAYVYTNSRKVLFAELSLADKDVQDLIENNKINKLNQIYILEYLMHSGKTAVQTLGNDIGCSEYTVKALAKKNIIKLSKANEVVSNIYDSAAGIFIPDKEICLTDEQVGAIETISKDITANRFEKYLLKGVTGSGKTEVYISLIEKCIFLGKTAFVLVPEISLTPLMIARFYKKFGDKVSFLHSRMTLKEKRENWKKIYNGECSIVIGPRSAIFSPLKNVGIIIVDEEHETSYKSETSPKYNAIEIAEFICSTSNAVLLLGSATPSVETYYRSNIGEIRRIELNSRTNVHGLPEVSIVDMRDELLSGNKTMFSRKLKFEIEKNLKNKQQTLLFINRRGYNSFVMCRECGEVIKCDYCNVSMTYHSKHNNMVCHLCGRTMPNVSECPKCASKKIKSFGAGTQKVEEYISGTYPDSSVIRMDMDTTSKREGHLNVLKKFDEESVDFLVGTQMVAKGHDFENVTLVGVLAADSSLFVQDFRAAERTFQLITQVSGRAGRGKHKGRVVVQSYNCDSYAIVHAGTQNYEKFYFEEIKSREILGLPPFSKLASILVQAADSNSAEQAINEICSFINICVNNNKFDNIEILGPAPASINFINGRYRFKLILKSTIEAYLREILVKILDKFYEQMAKNDIDVGVDINPFNML